MMPNGGTVRRKSSWLLTKTQSLTARRNRPESPRSMSSPKFGTSDITYTTLTTKPVSARALTGNESTTGVSFEVVQSHRLYENVNLSNVHFELLPLSEDEKSKKLDSSLSFTIKITTGFEVRKKQQIPKFFTINRNVEDFIKFDHHLQNSCIKPKVVTPSRSWEDDTNSAAHLPKLANVMDPYINAGVTSAFNVIEKRLCHYLDVLNKLKDSGNIIRCNKSLRWLNLDYNGNYCPQPGKATNETALIVGECVHEYEAKCRDELSMKPRDTILVTRVCDKSISAWWFGKNAGNKNNKDQPVTVGFFPHDCIKCLDGPVDSDKYFRKRKAVPITRPTANARAVSSRFGKNVLLLGKRLESRPKLNEIKNMSVYHNRATLEDLTHEGWDYPAIVELCTEFVSKHCVVQGVYRKSCNSKRLALLNESFWCKKFPKSIDDLISFCEQPNDNLCVACFIKQLFRDLSEPLFPNEHYDKLVTLYVAYEDNRSNGFDSKQTLLTKAIKSVIRNLPPVNRATLCLLVLHFRRLIVHVEKTDMNSENLAVVWAPNLFPHVTKMNSESSITVIPIRIQNFLLRWIIDEATTIFDLNKTPTLKIKQHQRSYSGINSTL